ncbi:Aste57867_369 [Aphanomyces stellatus]|uniref:Aste57867_369 protein n=1 Tax=Aphanomyces stellatus TaxID=120398 RepID=A0A485K2U6_9STRA|nr:hypothetical protein As57867_000368 [Aphanomyces stellatus]VFT77594.1 Aste57867_369 [Aphanomyces stellatus]
MEFEAPAFVDAPVSQDLAKPITATAALTAGQVLFAESAVVASVRDVELEDEVHEEGCDDDECGGCAAVEDDDDDAGNGGLDDDDIVAVSAYVKEHFAALMETCDPFDVLTMVDIRKNLFKCFHLADADATALANFQTMDVVAADAAACLDAAKALREAHAGAIPSSLTDDHVAHLIGVLNKYSIPLEDIGGSGLFLYVSKLKHSCTPNANFTDSGDAIWVTATEAIAAGEEITVDFFDTHYLNVAERQQMLAEEGQECSCAVCTGVAADKTRAFKCKVNGCVGIVHPTKDVFACATCGNVWDAAAIAAAQEEEATLAGVWAVETFEQLDAAIAGSVLHAVHHTFYHAMEAVTVMDSSLTEAQELAIYYRLLDALNYVAPFPHPEKVALFEKIAQGNVIGGDISKATDAYTQAYDMCVKVYGPLCDDTKAFKDLMDNTPTTVDELFGPQDDEDDE